MADLDVRVLDGNELPAWDALVASSDQGTVFHRSDWLEKTSSLWNHDLAFVGCFEGDALLGICPLLSIRPYGIVRVASSPAISNPYGGVIIANLERGKLRKRELHATRVILAILEHIARESYDYVNLVNSPGLQDIRPFIKRGWTPKVYYTYILRIEQDIMAGVSKDVRQNVRKAERLGIETKLRFDPEIYWSLVMGTFAKQHLPPPSSKEQLIGLLELIREKKIGEMRVATTPEGVVVAADVTLCDPNMAHSWSAASSEKHLSTGAASLLCRDIFADLRGRNHTKINLMSGNMAQLSSFIAGFNPDLVPYYGVEFSRPKYHLLRRLKVGSDAAFASMF